MDRGAWQATVCGVTRVRHNLVTKPLPQGNTYINKLHLNTNLFTKRTPSHKIFHLNITRRGSISITLPCYRYGVDTGTQGLWLL